MNENLFDTKPMKKARYLMRSKYLRANKANKYAALKLLFKNAAGKLSGVFMNNPKILENEVLLNFVSHNTGFGRL